MTDIVEQLRTSTAAYASYGHKMLHEAADEIERLRKEHHLFVRERAFDIAELNREIERLRLHIEAMSTLPNRTKMLHKVQRDER